MSNLPNIALMGYMGSGKSEAAELLVEHFHYARLSFAGTHPGGVRDVVARIWDTEAQNDRDKLIRVGEAVRAIDPEAWVRNAVAQLNGRNRLTEHRPGETDNFIDHPVVVDDLRFPPEAWALKGRDFVIVRIVASRNMRKVRLQASGKWQGEDQMDGPHDHALDSWSPDYQVWNGTSRRALFDHLVRLIEREQRV